MIDRERVMAKIAFTRSQVSSIRELLTARSREQITGDPWLTKGLIYSLQTAIEAMIDLLYHLAAKKYGYAPADARDALRVLVEKGLIPEADRPVYSAMIGFRNRVVHGYMEVSPERVYEMAEKELGDFERFISQIKGVLANDR